MKINARLKKIGDLVEANSFCLDVGCDHALLDIYLIKQRKMEHVVASDIAPGPLEQAKKNIQREGLEDQIETRLGPGLEPYTKDINTIIISGMGGRNIIGILKAKPKVLKQIDTLILSPNNYQEDVIANEEFVRDNRFIYQIIVLKRGERKYTKKEYFFGPVFLEKKGPLFREYYARELKSREILLSMLPKNYYLKRLQVKKEIAMIQKEITD